LVENVARRIWRQITRGMHWEPLLVPITRAGSIVYTVPSLRDHQARTKAQTRAFDDGIKTIVGTPEYRYPVGTRPSRKPSARSASWLRKALPRCSPSTWSRFTARILAKENNAMKNVKVGAASINQTPLDWRGNKRRIFEVVTEAKKRGVSLLVLQEMVTTGYNCDDWYLAPNTHTRAFRMLQEIAEATRPRGAKSATQGLTVLVGLPISFRNSVFNAVAVVAGGKICGFICKQFLANDGIHYEERWFVPWPKGVRATIAFEGIGYQSYPLGDIFFDIGGVRIGLEICEDAWVANRPGTDLALKGMDIIANPSMSHFAFGKTATRTDFVIGGSRAFGLTYIYTNGMGNEAGRAIYDGDVIIASAGSVLARGKRFSFREWELTTAVVNIQQTRQAQSASASRRPVLKDLGDECVHVDFKWPDIAPEENVVVRESWELDADNLKYEEFARSVSLGMFDYMRKTGSRGFVNSLSGGCDSTVIVALVRMLCEFAVADLGIEAVKTRLSYMTEIKDCTTARELANVILYNVYQGTVNSSDTTSDAARHCAENIAGHFHRWDVDDLVAGYTGRVETMIGRKLDWTTDDIAMQNIQARVRAPGVWLLANILGAILITTSNRSEGTRGYCTMDGDTAGGLAPLAGIDKTFLRKWLRWMETRGCNGFMSFSVLKCVTAQQPTAELRPLSEGQTDEKDLGPYEVGDDAERAAIGAKEDPTEVYLRVRAKFKQYSPAQLAGWVSCLFRSWGVSQWKRERLAPSFRLDEHDIDPRTGCRYPILSACFAEEIAELTELAARDQRVHEAAAGNGNGNAGSKRDATAGAESGAKS
jgi:NAD+ synthase (glutamine-hydrolysing)